MAVDSHVLFRSICAVLIFPPSSVTEHRVWLLEPRVQQQYTAYLSILNRNFSADLSSHNSPAFKKEAKGVENMVSKDSSDTHVH